MFAATSDGNGSGGASGADLAGGGARGGLAPGLMSLVAGIASGGGVGGAGAAASGGVGPPLGMSGSVGPPRASGGAGGGGAGAAGGGVSSGGMMLGPSVPEYRAFASSLDRERRVHARFSVPYMTKWGQSVVLAGSGALQCCVGAVVVLGLLLYCWRCCGVCAAALALLCWSWRCCCCVRVALLVLCCARCLMLLGQPATTCGPAHGHLQTKRARNGNTQTHPTRRRRAARQL